MSASSRQPGVVGYVAAHDRIRYDRGPASEYTCIECGGPAREWAFRPGTPEKRVLREGTGKCAGRPYSLDVNDYDPMCVQCHNNRDHPRCPSCGQSLPKGAKLP